VIELDLMLKLSGLSSLCRTGVQIDGRFCVLESAGILTPVARRRVGLPLARPIYVYLRNSTIQLLVGQAIKYQLKERRKSKFDR
jgi:hypothetical protein